MENCLPAEASAKAGKLLVDCLLKNMNATGGASAAKIMGSTEALLGSFQLLGNITDLFHAGGSHGVSAALEAAAEIDRQISGAMAIEMDSRSGLRKSHILEIDHRSDRKAIVEFQMRYIVALNFRFLAGAREGISCGSK